MNFKAQPRVFVPVFSIAYAAMNAVVVGEVELLKFSIAYAAMNALVGSNSTARRFSIAYAAMNPCWV